MAMVLAIMGESGSGKTTSLRNLPPAETFYIDADGKGLSWKGWRSQYNREAKNYARTSDKEAIMKCLAMVQNTPSIKYLVVDTFNGIMVDDEMSRMQEKGYDKWQDMAVAVYGIVGYMLKMRDDLTCLCLFHSQTERDDMGNVWTRIKTSGKKLDKIVLESKFTTVLLSKCVDGKYVYETHSNSSTAKTPLGAFEESTVPNDIVEVIKRLEEYR